MPTLESITSFLNRYIKTADLQTVTIKNIRQMLSTELGAEQGTHYEKAWLKESVDQICLKRMSEDAPTKEADKEDADMELRSALGKRKLSTTGLKSELEARLEAAKATEELETVQLEAKRCKNVMNSLADEYICPITQELPLEPVIAEDGKVYEKGAIEEWLRKQKRSPITGLPMGTRLMPATQARNTIEQLVQSGAIEGEKAASWKKKLNGEKKLKQLRERAEAGDADAMYNMGNAYTCNVAKYGLTRDSRQACAWFERGARLQHPKCMATYGGFLLKGCGGEKLPALGLVFLGQAASLGSDVAAFFIGRAFIEGRDGLPKDIEMGKHWLRKASDGQATIKHLKSVSIETAVAMLAQASA